jgi:hypothetical protein
MGYVLIVRKSDEIKRGFCSNPLPDALSFNWSWAWLIWVSFLIRDKNTREPRNTRADPEPSSPTVRPRRLFSIRSTDVLHRHPLNIINFFGLCNDSSDASYQLFDGPMNGYTTEPGSRYLRRGGWDVPLSATEPARGTVSVLRWPIQLLPGKFALITSL